MIYFIGFLHKLQGSLDETAIISVIVRWVPGVMSSGERAHLLLEKYVIWCSKKPDGEQMPKWYIQRLFKKAYVPSYRLHDLRHSFNTNMLKAGVSQPVIMNLTKHKTNEMFLRYSHLDQKQGEGTMKKRNQLLAGQREFVDQ